MSDGESARVPFAITAPNVYNTQSGVPPREVPFRAIELGEVALRSWAS